MPAYTRCSKELSIGTRSHSGSLPASLLATSRSILTALTPVGAGVQRGTLAQFPIYQIDLATLPITLATFPLLMVYKGAREREIVQFFLEHYQELGEMGYFIELLHPQALQEVLQEMDIKPEILRGFDLDLPAILELFGPRKVIQTIGWKKIIQNLDASTLSEQERASLIEQLRQLDRDGN